MPKHGMLIRSTLALCGAALVAALAVSAAGASSTKHTGNTLTGAGSTFVQPLVGLWIPAAQSALGINLSYSGIGSGGGVAAITNKQADMGMSDAPLSQFSPTCATCVQIPWALAGTAVM